MALSLPAIFFLCLIRRYAVDVLWCDDWLDAADLIMKAASGALSSREIFAPFSDHRIAVPRIATLLLWKLGGGLRNLPAMELGWILLCCIGLVLLIGFHRATRTGRSLSLWYFAPVTLWLFTPFQFFFLQGGLAGGGSYTSLQWLFAVLGSASALLLLESSVDLDFRFFLSIAAAGLATLSNASGLMVWPAGLGAKFLLPATSSAGRRRQLAVWGLLWIGAWAFYFHGLTPSAGPGFAARHLLLTAQYILSYWGIPVTFGYLSAGLLVNFAALAIIVQAARNDVLKDCRFGFYLWFFVLTVSLETTAGRLSSEPGGAGTRASDFYLLPTLGMIGLYYLSLAVFSTRSKIRACIGAGFAGLALCSYRTAAHEWRTVKFTYQTSAYALRNHRLSSDMGLEKAALDAQTVRRIAPFLEENKLNLFSRPASRTTSGSRDSARGTSFAVEEINGKPFRGSEIPVSPAEGLELKGWAFDAVSGRPAADVFIVVDGFAEVPVSYGEMRRDISGKLGVSGAAYCGWLASFVPEALGLKPGRHSLSLKTLSSDGTYYYRPRPEGCGNCRSLWLVS